MVETYKRNRVNDFHPRLSNSVILTMNTIPIIEYERSL